MESGSLNNVADDKALTKTLLWDYCYSRSISDWNPGCLYRSYNETPANAFLPHWKCNLSIEHFIMLNFIWNRNGHFAFESSKVTALHKMMWNILCLPLVEIDPLDWTEYTAVNTWTQLGYFYALVNIAMLFQTLGLSIKPSQNDSKNGQVLSLYQFAFNLYYWIFIEYTVASM